MDTTNRIIIIGGALVWIFFVLVVLLLAWGAPENSVDALDDFVGYLDDHTDDLSRLILSLGGIILMLLAIIVVIAELTPPATQTVTVQQVKSGSAVIAVGEIEQRVVQEVQMVPHVTQAAVKVLGRRRGIELDLDLHVDPEANLSETAEEACRRTADLVRGSMGIALLELPRAHLHYRELHLAASAGEPETPELSREGPARPEEAEEEAGTSEEAALPSEGSADEGEAKESEEDRPATA